MVVPFFDSARQDAPFQAEINDAILGVVDSRVFVDGPQTKLFEEEWAVESRVKHSIFCSNGTSALEIALRCYGLDGGQNVAVTSNSFYASASAITTVGSNVVFCDTDQTCNLDLNKLERMVCSKNGYNISGVIAVNLYGNCLDHKKLQALCKEKNVVLIGDLAQAHFCKYKGQNPAEFFDIGCFSFYVSKTLGCYGEAGCLVTNDDNVADMARSLRNHGLKEKLYVHYYNGSNQRGQEIQAAVLRVKLKHKDYYINERIRIAARYRENLKTLPEILLKLHPDNTRLVHYVFPIFTQYRNELRAYLNSYQIIANINYPLSLDEQPYYKEGYTRPVYYCPNSRKQCNEVLSLPFFAGLENEAIDYVSENIIKFFASVYNNK